MAYRKSKNEIPAVEYCIAIVIFLVGLFFRTIYIFRYRVNTDEPQHLHVVWSWTKGMLQYRDVFDNHTPLFHILCTPFLYIIRENANVLYYMRLVMIPLFIIAMICTYIIARNLFSKRAGIWAIALISLYPAFFFCSLQYRAGVLWMVLWLAGLAVILGKPPRPYKFFLAGLFFGLAICTSFKTVLLLFSLAIAVLFTVILDIKSYKGFSWHRLFNLFISSLAGILLMPVVFIGFFAWQKALEPLFYCTISHNILPQMGHWKEIWRLLLFLILLPILFLINRYLNRSNKGNIIDISRQILLLTVIIYYLTLFSFWPVVTRQNFLPVYSLIFILLIPKLLKWLDLLRNRHAQKTISRFYPVLILMFLSALELLVIFLYNPLWENNTKEYTSKIAEVLKLTDPSDFVIDQKGETVFRPRPCYYKLEAFTVERMRRGIIPDNIAEELIAKRCCVASTDISRFPIKTRDFIWINYIPIGDMRVAGKFLEACSEKLHVFRFDVCIPAYYVIVGENRKVMGTLDNTHYTGVRFLESGAHEFISSDMAPGRFALLWAKAADRGFSPFRN